MHNIYPYHAKFNQMIPAMFIKKYSAEGDLVLDPFCGCGTTLLEALKLKRNAIGVKILNLKQKKYKFIFFSIDTLYKNIYQKFNI